MNVNIRRGPLPTDNYTIISNTVLCDKRLTWTARGVLLYLLSKPADWQISVQNLINETKDSDQPLGRDGVYKAMSHLIKAGYMRKVPMRGEDGTFSSFQYQVTDRSYPLTDLPDTAQPDTANPTQQRTDLLQSTELNKSTSDFSDFWTQYPRKIAKPKAEKAYARAVKKTPPGEILSGLMVWKMYWDNPQFIPHPATWLNDERWNDAPPEKRNERNNASQQSAGRSTAYLGIALGNLAQGNGYPTGEYGP